VTPPADSDAAGRLLVVTSTWPLYVQDARTPFVRNLAQDLAARGWEVEVLAPHAPGAAEQEQDGAIAVRRFRYMWPERLEVLAYGAGGLINMRAPGRKLLALPFVAAEILAVRAALRRFRPDVVHAHWLLPQGFAAAVAVTGVKVPLVTTIHGGDVFGLRSAVFQPFKRLAARRANAVTVNGKETLSSAIALGADPGRTQTIKFAPGFEGEVAEVDVSNWRSRYPADCTIVLFVGRLVPEKGASDFIIALARATNKKLFGVVCGDGPMRSELETLAHEYGLQDRVAFEGWLQPNEVACRMAGADALLFPSKRSPDGWVEAQGVVLVEAMRRNLPILASRSGGIPDLIEDGRTGWLFPEGDIDAMASLVSSFEGKSAPTVAEVTARARNIALTEINRDRTAIAFHEFFTRVIAEQGMRRGSKGDAL
jgi:phosphatidyl-myo-inositol dimannoside synthase